MGKNKSYTSEMHVDNDPSCGIWLTDQLDDNISTHNFSPNSKKWHHMYDINQRFFFDDRPRWRIHYTADQPLVISFQEIVALAVQLGLPELEILAMATGQGLPTPLLGRHGEMESDVRFAQWLYKDVLKALITASPRVKRVPLTRAG
ncbi:hypothetical protein OPKNFCMD_3265 [Methylobacterium crusticola]|uniref:Uncharacterized protein n=1 Tax=Methylobacterium crusticola TaxID=1697972 RepID=A0ABQ4QZC6_9HYPH|nr:hypothetical protein [Methylobacterium crusticola]GJD50522.1 hypothetical protein OPKNFCMD_3265 [Methylobacterium crusticola]